MKNKSLFWYGFRGKLKRAAGLLLIIIGLFLGAVHWIITLIFIALGIYLIATGTSQRFDYKMQSGTMVHKGDW